jgi:NAD-dependent deacetylase
MTGTGGGTDAGTDLARAKALMERARQVVVLTGAGISTDSGIADFRGPKGVWTKDPAAEKASPLWEAQPNEGHAAIVALERTGRLDTLVTQNIDGLHQKAGSDPGLLVEIHGNSSEIVCLRCDHRQPAGPVHDRVRAGEEDPACREPTVEGSVCGGILKSATISFGQSLVAADLRRAEEAAARCDLLLCVGSTLAVYPAAGLVPIAAHSGAVVVIVNGGPTDMDAIADVVVNGSISEILPALVTG